MESVLPRDLRRKLEAVVVKAREIAEGAARTELERLSVGEKAPAAYLSDDERKLRNRLRAHGRQLGDRRKPDGAQAIDLLVTEVAYEHWHRMLFARFLAECNLLIYQDGVTPLSIHDCFDLAEEETGDRSQGWQYAAGYASKMLPQIFGVDSPAFELNLAPNDQKQLEDLLASLDEATFVASDALGWVYQFWQAKKKDEVNASEVKIGAQELPAVTQLFTEPYMVSFLLDNSLGAWWAARRLTEADLQKSSSEEELRRKAAIPGVPLDYLRFVQQEDDAGKNRWTPAAGTFDGWPEQLADLKTLDPCCGSGHFLVAAFLMLVPMRMERDGLSAREAVNAVLRENIHGLELDQRCVELAAFALALTAWKYPNAGGYRVLPELNVACSGLSISAKKEEWLALAGDNTNLRLALEGLFKQFKDAPVLGSLINTEASLGKGSLFELKWEEVGPLLTKALAGEKDDEKTEMSVIAQGLAKSAEILSQKMVWIVTNVPYLSRVKQHDDLKVLLERFFPDAKGDIATAFIERLISLLEPNGAMALVSPQNWLFQPTYRKFRTSLLKKSTLNSIARLGPGAFETISGEVVKAILLTLQNKKPKSDCYFFAIDSSTINSAEKKSEHVVASIPLFLNQIRQIENPDSRIVIGDSSEQSLLNEMADAWQGICTGDYPRFGRVFWEFDREDGDNWLRQITTVSKCVDFGGRTNLFYWQNGAGEFIEYLNDRLGESHGAWVRGLEAWGRKGIVISQTNNLPVTLYTGESFDNNAAVMVPNDESNLPALWAYCSSDNYHLSVREIDQALKVTNKTLVKVPFDSEEWSTIAIEKYPNGLPKPYSDDPTQWIFHGHPCGSVIWDEKQKRTVHKKLRVDGNVLYVAVARLLGYRWPAELDASMELADEQREWVKRCEALASYADDDGIVCIPPVRGE